MRCIFLMLVTMLLLVGASLSCSADTYRVRLDPAARESPATGRVILLFVTETRRPYDRVLPMEAPFFGRPQPIASIAVTDFKPGDAVTIDGGALAFPGSLDALEGTVRVQAVLDADQTERSFLDGPGNVYSEVVEANVTAAREDVVDITLSHRVQPRQRAAEPPNLRYVEMRSEVLSAFHGRDVYHRAGVALPKGHDMPDYPRQRWPAIYIIPGYGGRDDEAAEYAQMLLTTGVEDIAPIAVHIVLDPESPLGHHGFADSACNGPVGTALVREFIPYLEREFRLIAQPEARIVTGHSSGGWSSLWLQLKHAETFGACWSRSPDPVDFSAFQMTDIYADASMFTQSDGRDTPSYRGWTSPSEQGVLMTVRQERGMEHAIDPAGRSGQQWDAWMAMFSPRNDATGLPKPMFDPSTGAIHKDVVEAWKAYDIARLIEGDPNRYGRIMLERVRLACGEQDSYYLDRAVVRLRDKVRALQDGGRIVKSEDARGYILLVPRADHATVIPHTHQHLEQRDARALEVARHARSRPAAPAARAIDPDDSPRVKPGCR